MRSSRKLLNQRSTFSGEDHLVGAVTVKPHARKRGKRKPLPKDIPREVVIIDLPEAEKVAPDGSALRVMGHEVSEKLVYEPATAKIIEYHRLKYGGAEGQDTVKVAPVLPCIVPKSIVTPSLLSQIITSKFSDGLPLYRQETIFARIGIEIPRSSMGRWIVTAYRGCVGIWNALEERLMRSPYASCDETPCKYSKKKGALRRANPGCG
jgi:transposase